MDNSSSKFDEAVKNITELGESKNKLTETEMKYRDIIENMVAAVFISTPGPVGKFIEVNDAAVNLLGAESKEDLLSRRPSDLYADPSGRKKVSDEVVKNGFVKNMELDLVNYKGKKITVLASVVFKNDERGQFFYGTFIDITERKEIEDRLMASDAVFKKSQEVAHVGSWTLNLMTTEVIWSDEAHRIFGFEPGNTKLDLESVLSFIHPDDKKRVEEISKAAYSGKIPAPFEYRLIRPDKSIRHIQTVSYGEFSEGGKLTMLSGIIQDITDRKKFELDLLEKIKELERMNALMVNRELKMIELKSEIVKLKEDTGEK